MHSWFAAAAAASARTSAESAQLSLGGIVSGSPVNPISASICALRGRTTTRGGSHLIVRDDKRKSFRLRPGENARCRASRARFFTSLARARAGGRAGAEGKGEGETHLEVLVRAMSVASRRAVEICPRADVASDLMSSHVPTDHISDDSTLYILFSILGQSHKRPSRAKSSEVLQIVSRTRIRIRMSK
jgi:hypothetical protein